MSTRISGGDLPIAVSPAELIREELAERGLTEQDLARLTGLTEDESAMLFGDDPQISEEMSGRLSKALGTSPGFWSRMDVAYQQAKSAGKPVATIAGAKQIFAKGSASGNLAVRVPASLHSRLIEHAKEQGTSLNQMVLSLLSEGVGRLDSRTGR